MKKIMFALEKAYFQPELKAVCFGNYYDGENRGYNCSAVYVEIKHNEPYAMRLATLEKICKRYHAKIRYYNNYGFPGWSATVYEIITEPDYENAMQAMKKQNIALTAFYKAMQDGATQEKAMQAMKTAVNAA